MLRKVSLIVAILSIFVVLDSRLANGQEISVDGNTATIIMKNGDRITIDGNTLSKDGKNLFHSFREFGLTNQQIATFLTNPNIQNILTRVTGGNPSYINGLIEVVGGNSNLFLMNPAGIVFGQGASINVPADFTATTATGIGFNNGILNAIGNNDYQNLTGNPTNFIFNNNQPGSIINAGDLKVAQGSNINLIGGNVINTGTIETPNGKINIQAVEGTSRIKITPEGSLLSLEIDIPKDEQGNLLGFTPQDLPTLLTGANQTGVSTPNVAVKNNQVQVANTNIPNETGIAIASGKISTSSETLGGEVTVLGNKVGVIDGEIEANGATGGGKVLIGGDRQGKGTIPNASVTVVDKNSSIKADATVNGNGGEVIVFAEDHASIHGELTAQGGKISGDGGFIETSGLNSFNITSVPDASAVNGKAGEWLIDPYDINIVADDNSVNNINTENPFIAFGNDAILPVGLIKNGLLRGDVIVSTGTGTDPDLPQEGNITWNSDATLNYDGIGTGKTLTLQAANNIIFNGTIDTKTISDSLNVVFSSDFDNNQAGAIALFNGFINTNGGNIILAGAENSAAVGGYNPAYGTIGSPDGVYILNSTLDSGNGNINIIGTGLDGGITLQGNTILSTNNGNITLVGIAQGSGEQNHGIDFNNAEIANETIIVEATGSGNINLTGRHIGNGTGSAGILTTGDNPNNLSRITSNTGSITLTGETNATTSGGSTSVGVSILQNSQVNSIGGGNININATSINNNDGVDVRNNGRIVTSGRTVFNTGNDDIFISNTSLSNFGTVEIISARNVALKDINDLDLGTSNISQDLSVVTGNASSGGNITDSGAVSVIGATILNPNNADIILDNSSNDFNIVSVNNANNVILTDINDLTLSNVDSSGNPIDINISGDLDLRVAQINTINSNIQARSLTTDALGTTILNGNVTTTRNQIYGDAVIIGNSVSLATTNNEITFNNTVNSEEGENNNLTLNSGRRNLTFNQALGNNQPLGDITANSSGITRFNSTVNSNSLTTDAGGRTILSGNVTTTGDQTYNDNIFLEQNTILDTNNLIARSIEVDKESPNPISITINARDSVSISGKPDRIIPLAIGTAKKIDQSTGDITVNAVNNINLGGAVNTTATNRSSFAGDAGNISIISERGDVSIPGIATFGTISSGSVNISGNNLSLGPILTFLNPAAGISNNINLQGNNITVRGVIQAESLTTSGNMILTNNPLFQALDNPGFAALGNANVTTIENQNYNNSLNILSNANLTSTQGDINFSDNVNTGSNNLNIRSLTGVNFSDNALVSSANGNLFIQTTDRSGNILIGSGDENQFVINNLDQANGFNMITIGQNNTRGSITINENLTINDPLILQARNIFVNQTINGNDNASITIKGAKNTTTLNADIFTQGNDIIIDDNVILGGNVTLATNNGSNISGNIDILGTINGNQDLTLNAGSGNVSIVGAIGNNRALNNLTVTANTTNLNGGFVSTTGNQTFNSNIQLSNNTSFQSQGFFTSENIISQGNNVNIVAENINTENIDTTNLDGNGGNVTLSATNDIEVSSIDTSSSNGNGGNVNISTLGRLRVTDTIANTDISIDASGTNEGGAITINFFPDNSQGGKTSDPRLPFVVGDPTNNGTQGIITNGEFSIAPDQYFEVVQEGNINVILLDPVPQTPNGDPRDEKLQQLIEEGDPNNAVPPRLEVKTLAVNLYPPVIPIATITEAQEILTTIEKEAAEKPAFIYVSFTPKGYQPRDLEDEFARREAVNTQEYSQVDINLPNLQPTIALKPAQEDQLDLLVITRKGPPLRVTIPVTREQVVGAATNLWSTVSDIFALNDDYKPYATELYSWLVAPLEDKLKEEEISNLLFILPPEIRFIPIAALYDSNSDQFLVEKYSSGLAPSLNLNDNRYRPIKDLNLLAMGAAQFADDQVTPLPAVGLELPTIKKVWNDKPTEDYQRYLNNNFTLEEIKQNIASQPFGIVHFGTHGQFNPTETTDSFIQLYNSRLGLGDLRNLGLNQPLVELMVLSACETAFGNEIAELGFAGLAVQAGVKTAMGSVWQVSDTGTLALMTDFYGQLKIQSTKAESLRQAQLNMLTGKVYKSDDGNKIITPQQEVSLETLPENSRQKENFSHPFYWAPFTMIGNPW